MSEMPFFFFFSDFCEVSASGDRGLAVFFFFADVDPSGRGLRTLPGCFFLGVARVGVRKGVVLSVISSGSSNSSSSDSCFPGEGARLDYRCGC